MRLIDADALMEHVGRDRLDSRELIMRMIENASTIYPSANREPDWEKVCNALNICTGRGKCEDCKYNLHGGYSTMDCRKPMMRDALILLTERRETIKHSTDVWYDVTIRQPEFGESVICMWADGRIALGVNTVDYGWCGHPIGLMPTHLMPLPKPPKKEGGQK